MTYKNIGAARDVANHNAKRDQIDWSIYWDSYYKTYKVAENFRTDAGDYYTKKVEVVPYDKTKVDKEAVLLSPAEKALVAAVLDPDEIGREYYPADEKTKTSLWKKLIGAKS